jgi:hypothetical protein
MNTVKLATAWHRDCTVARESRSLMIWGLSMPMNYAELMSALLATAALAMLLQPFATPHPHPELERLFASLTWERIAQYNACAMSDGMDCLMIP